MGSYSSPDAARIRRLTGVDELMDGGTANDFDAALLALLPDAEDETALRVGEALFGSALLTDRQIRALQNAASLRTGATYLRTIAAKKAAAAKRPHIMEESERILAVADALDAQAVSLDETVKGEEIEAPPAAAGRVTRRARIGVITVDPYSLTVRPSQRIELGDEREDLPAGTGLARDGAGVP